MTGVLPAAHRSPSTASRAAPDPTGRCSWPADATTLTYRPGLDGLRAVAVIAVFLFHGGVDVVPGGYLAVSTFFTLSGFLITLLLFREWDAEGRIALVAFWDRRVRRLLPAAAIGVALAALTTVLVGTASQRQNFAGDGLATLTDVANWRLVLADKSYAQLFQAPSPLQHAWSLAIEAQFYWVYPLLFIGGLRLVHGDRRRFGLLLGALFVGSVVLVRLAGFSADRIYYGTDTRAAELLAGAILGVMVASAPGAAVAAGRRRPRRLLDAASAGAMALLVVAWIVTPQGADWIGAGGLGIYAIVSAVVIAGAGATGTLLSRALSTAPLRALGRISYGFYLFHWPVLLLISADRVPAGPVVRLGLAATLTTVLAAASYRLVERPIRTRTRPFDAVRLRSIIGGCAMAALVPTIVVACAPARGGEPPSAFDGARPGLTPASFAPPAQPLRLAVVGDSVGTYLGPMLTSWGAGARTWEVDSLAQWGCPLLRGGVAHSPFGDREFGPECSTWPDDWRRMLADAKPDVVLLAGGFWDAVDRRMPGDDTWRAPGDPVQDRRLHDEYDLALDVLTSTGVPVLWLDHPAVRSGGSEAATIAQLGADPAARMRRLDEIQREVVVDHPLVEVVASEAFLRAWPGGFFDERLRPDGVHFDGAGAQPFVDWLGPEIVNGYRSMAPPTPPG